MTDRYIIEEQYGDIKIEYVLIETGFKPMTLGKYPTKLQAEKSKAEWIARDELQDKISDFIDEMLEEFENRLEDNEIRAMIKEH